MVYMTSEGQCFGVFTKALEGKKFEKHVDFLMNVGCCRSENDSESVGYDRPKGMAQWMAWSIFCEQVAKLMLGAVAMINWKQRTIKSET